MEKIEDKTRINKALNDLLARNLRNDPQNKSKPYDINDDAMSLLMDYASEMSCAIIESASALAQHRKSVEIDASDISLILAKKFGIDIPGTHNRVKTLYKNVPRKTLESNVISSLKTNEKNPDVNATSERKLGLKRKLSAIKEENETALT